MMTDVARVHLRLFGASRCIELTIPIGPVRLEDLLPTARSLIDDVSAIAVEEAPGAVSCGPGCGACCRHLVILTVAEACRLAELVRALPEPRRGIILERFRDALTRLEQAGLLGPRGRRTWHSDAPGDAARDQVAIRYFRLGIACPFLQDESCSIHAERPLVCREYLVMSPPELCVRNFEQPIDMVPHLGVTRALGRASHKLWETIPEGIPLLLALEYCAQHMQDFRSTVDGLEAFRALLQELGETRELDPRLKETDAISSVEGGFNRTGNAPSGQPRRS